MKKILFFTQDNFDAVSSRAPLSKWIFKNKNVQCDILCPEGIEINLPNANVFYFKRRGLTYENYIILKKLIKQENYDLIIPRAIEQIILTTLVKTRKIKIIFFLAGFGKLFDQGPRLNFLIRTLYKPFFKLLIYFKSAGLVLQNIEDIRYLGVKNTHLMNGSGIDNIVVEKKKKFDKIRIVTATRLKKTKGLSDIFDFCELIITKKNIEYYILGDFRHLSSSEKSKIRQFNSSANIFFEGFQFPITNYLNKCHYAYYPTKYPEGSPRFLIESLMHGLILFTNPMPGCPDLVSNKNGFLSTSPIEVLKKINEISYEESNYNNLSNNSIEHFFAKYESNVVYEKLFNYLDITNS